MDSIPGRALVVDDERSIRMICQSVLERMGFTVETCESGVPALHRLDETQVDLLLIDLLMPDIDGVEVLRRIRHRANRPAIIVVTGRATLEDTAQTTLLGAQGILLKPFSVEQLSAMVDEVLRKRRDERAAAQFAALHPLMGISEQLLNELDVPRLCDQIVTTAREGLPAERALLLLRNSDQQQVRIAAAAESDPNQSSFSEHLANWVMTQRRPLLLNAHGEAPPALRLLLQEAPIHPVLCVPIIARNRVLGVLYAERSSGATTFTPANRDLLTLLAGQVAIALENARLYSLAQRRAERFQKLNELSTALTATLERTQILDIAAQHLEASLPLASGVLILRDDQGLIQQSYFGLHDSLVTPPQARQLESGVIGTVLRKGEPRLVPSARTTGGLPLWERQWLTDDNQAFLCAPLATENGISGAILAVGLPGAALGDEELQFLVATAGPVALAIEKSQLHASVVRSEARYRALLDHARDAVLLLNSDASRVLEANPAALTLSGHTREDMMRLNPTDFIVAPVLRNGPVPLHTLINGGVSEFETQLRTSNGREVPIAVGISEVTHEGAHYLLLIARDMSERWRLAQRLIQTEKLAGMGRLAASVAHEINNPLHGLQNSLHLVLNRPLEEDKRQRLLLKASEEVEQLVTIVRRMLDFYRPSREGMRPISPHEVLEQVLALATPQLQQSEIRVEREWDAHLPRVMGVGGHLKQVFLSLVLNAVDAMVGGGRLLIRTRVGVDPNDSDQRVVLVEFTDSGPGISTEEIQKIFEPFYTTRINRSGLGLAVSYSIVEQHEGSLSVTTTEEGSTFRVALPIARGY